ncbi:hypothetical protein GCM10023085_13490 [Actinomadura viridis]
MVTLLVSTRRNRRGRRERSVRRRFPGGPGAGGSSSKDGPYRVAPYPVEGTWGSSASGGRGAGRAPRLPRREDVPLRDAWDRLRVP